ncbi:MAG: hypothetical protein HeimC2_33430 [Candidatus Heimdallarchaeota archaeon LC_2]|nr:MAG: hypothetical protein HeimC2_33430 [Candidatus Heimdallarchaeota archaeon LC_2]
MRNHEDSKLYSNGTKNTDILNLKQGFEELNYITDEGLVTSIYLLRKLGRPLLLEGNAGVGKTEVAKSLASLLNVDLIRLQCYEGLDINSSIYEWNYQKQLLAIKMQEGENISIEEKEKHIFSHDFILERPLLKSIQYSNSSPVLLIDEIDRADEEFEALLLELLSDFQISIPEMGTIKAKYRPLVILTSNRTRELSDALKRRCLYHWIDYPDMDKEIKIVNKKIPNLKLDLATQVVRFIQLLRSIEFSKTPGVAETLDWASALLVLDIDQLDKYNVELTVGSILKSVEDIKKLKDEGIENLIAKSIS